MGGRDGSTLQIGCKAPPRVRRPSYGARMRVSVLGPLQVTVDRSPVEVAGPLPRRLLALLAAAGGRPVSVDALIDGLWAEQPPASARQTLQSHVARLRRAVGARRVDGAPSGYRLQVEPDDIDALAFPLAVRRARELASPGERAATLRAALELWRGPAYVEFLDSLPLAAEAVRLEELRGDALQERWEAELGCPDITPPVAELEALVRTYPTREGLWSLLMHALYRAGRQADALETFQRARRVLVAEIGIEPGPALRAMESRVLAQDPTLVPSPSHVVVPAAAASPKARSHRRPVVVLAVELVVAADDPEDSASQSARLWETVAGIGRAHGAYVQPERGGVVLLFFGVPVAHEDDAQRAIDAAAALAAEMTGASAPRLGLAAGEALVTARADGYDVVGRPVAEADRLRSRAGPGEVLVDHAARRLLGGADVGDAESQFVGRERDVALLRSACEKVTAESDVQVVIVVGEAGLGKSRLIRELQWSTSADVQWLVTRCRPYGDAGALAPLADLVRAQLGLESDDDAGAGSALASQLPGLGAQMVEHITQLVDGDAPATAQHGTGLSAAVRAWLTEVATLRPTAIVVEDLHWASPTLLELLEELTNGLHAVPLLVVVSTRPELLDRRTGWGARATTLRLAPLPDDVIAQLLEPAGDRANELVQRSGGVPLYAEQLLSWSEQSEGEAPPTLRSLLHARLDTLPDDSRQLLEIAAVAGPAVWSDELNGLVSADFDLDGSIDVDRATNLLIRRHFLRRVRPSQRAGQDEFVFWHDLLRETAEARLPRIVRARRHLAVAQWWAERSDAPPQRVDHAANTAFDLACTAGDTELMTHARPLACAAAFRAGCSLEGVDTPAALRQLHRAFELCDDDALRIRIRYWLGAALHDNRQFASAADELTTALDALLAEGDPLAVDALLFLAATLFNLGRPFEPVEKAARSLVHTLPPSDAAVRNLATLAMLRLIAQTQTSLHEAQDLAGQAIAMADQYGCGGDALAHVIRGRARLSLGDGDGLQELESGLDEVLRQESGAIALGTRQWLAGALHHWRGPAAELTARRELEQMARERGLEFIVSSGIAEDIRVLCELGRYEQALALSEVTLDLDEAQTRWVVVQRALALLDVGRIDTQTVAEVAATPPADPHDLRHVLGVAAVVTTAALDSGDPAKAREVLSGLGELQRFVERDGAVELLPRVVRLAIRAGCPEVVRGITDVATVDTPLRRLIAVTIEGLTRAVDGDEDRAVELLRKAEEGWAALDFAAEAGAVHDDLANFTHRKPAERR